MPMASVAFFAVRRLILPLVGSKLPYDEQPSKRALLRMILVIDYQTIIISYITSLAARHRHLTSPASQQRKLNIFSIVNILFNSTYIHIFSIEITQLPSLIPKSRQNAFRDVLVISSYRRLPLPTTPRLTRHLASEFKCFTPHRMLITKR